MRILRALCALILVAWSSSTLRSLTGEDTKEYYSETPDQWALADGLDPLPGWDYGEMVQGLRRELKQHHPVKHLKVRLLAWSIQEDDRPLLIDSALLWASFESKQGKRWVLSHMFRHPRTYPGWSDATPTDVDWSDTMVLPAPPTNRDIALLADSGRHHASFFAPFGPDYVIHSSDVREKTWQAAIGEPANQRFPNER